MPVIPLLDFHKRIGAEITNFAGYEMPLSYTQLKQEYFAVRKNVGLFDISHMSPISIRSNSNGNAKKFLDFITSRNIIEKKNTAQYNTIINKDFYILDDIVIYCLGIDYYVVIVNASNQKKILDYFHTIQKDWGYVIDIAPYKNYIFLALQGKKSDNWMKKVFPEYCNEIDDLYFYEFFTFFNKNFCCLVSRTGYTGEDGFEILVPEEIGNTIANFFYQSQIQFCGLAIRNVLRMEMSYLLYGSEITEVDTPYNVGLEWLISTNKKSIASKSLESAQKSNKSTIMGFILQDTGMARDSFPIYNIEEEKHENQIGTVTSGSFSFLWGKGFGLAKIKKSVNYSQIFYVDIRGKFKPIQLFPKMPYIGSIKYKKNK